MTQDHCYRRIESHDFISDEFTALPIEKKQEMMASALAGVMEEMQHVRIAIRRFADHRHTADGQAVVVLSHNL